MCTVLALLSSRSVNMQVFVYPSLVCNAGVDTRAPVSLDLQKNWKFFAMSFVKTDLAYLKAKCDETRNHTEIRFSEIIYQYVVCLLWPYVKSRKTSWIVSKCALPALLFTLALEYPSKWIHTKTPISLGAVPLYIISYNHRKKNSWHTLCNLFQLSLYLPQK